MMSVLFPKALGSQRRYILHVASVLSLVVSIKYVDRTSPFFLPAHYTLGYPLKLGTPDRPFDQPLTA